MAAASSPAAAITCRAAVAWAPGQALVMEEVEVAPPEAMEIRVKVVSTSICRSDVTQWQSTVHAQRSEDPLLAQGETCVPLLCSVKLQRVHGCALRLRGEGRPNRADGQDMPAELWCICRAWCSLEGC
ncbi:Os02g0637700 [Oryza sativa Japonica Group]|uniref:Os02g0637700 protein n=1 Tax=Oryza sativa subsp. japonica TaxID=39947 RepID=A0A0P0VM43_ORYSJ|nr:hypothetical protein EE612_012600 [Oryza sativa]BAS79950.1 Os02g0637700 [Oryza sativa Japonica Group]